MVPTTKISTNFDLSTEKLHKIHSENYRKIYNEISEVITKYQLKKVILFGSRARGDNRIDSDYDFYIDAPNITSLLQLGCLFDDMKKALNAEVDIVLFPDKYTKIKPYLLNAISEEGVVIYG